MPESLRRLCRRLYRSDHLYRPAFQRLFQLYLRLLPLHRLVHPFLDRAVRKVPVEILPRADCLPLRPILMSRNLVRVQLDRKSVV